MKYVELTGVKELTVKEMPTPKGDDRRPVIKVETCGICGSDIHYWDDGVPLGLVMGHEFAGTVVNPGDRKDLKPGDRVHFLPTAACMECEACLGGNSLACPNKADGRSPGIIAATEDRVGGYAEYYQGIKGAYLYPIPDGVSFEDACMVEPSTVGYHTVVLGEVKKGDNVLVTGAGLIGAMTIQWAKTMGAKKVMFTEINEARARKVLEMGYADVWVNEVPGAAELLKEFDDAVDDFNIQLVVAAKLKQLLGVGIGFDSVLECSGHHSALNLSQGIVKPYGKAIWTGVRFHTFPMQHALTLFNSVTIKSFLGTPATSFEACRKAIFDGTYPVKHYHTSSATLDTVQEAFKKLTAPGNAEFKIIIYPQKEKV